MHLPPPSRLSPGVAFQLRRGQRRFLIRKHGPVSPTSHMPLLAPALRHHLIPHTILNYILSLTRIPTLAPHTHKRPQRPLPPRPYPSQHFNTILSLTGILPPPTRGRPQRVLYLLTSIYLPLLKRSLCNEFPPHTILAHFHSLKRRPSAQRCAGFVHKTCQRCFMVLE